MSGEVYHLAKKDYLSSVNNTFKELIDDTDLTDVTLACDDHTIIKAHRLILSSNSAFFRHIIGKTNNQNAFIYLKGVKKEDLKSIVQFIYLGETNVASENLDSFLETSQELQIRGLIDILGNNAVNKRKTIDFMESNEKFPNSLQTQQKDLDEQVFENQGSSVVSSQLSFNEISLNREFHKPIPTIEGQNRNVPYFEPEQKNFDEKELNMTPNVQNSTHIPFNARTIKKENAIPTPVTKSNEGYLENFIKKKEAKLEKNILKDYKCDNIKLELLETVLPFECKKCNYKSVEYSDLKLHDIAIHRNSKYPCENCEFHTNKKPAFIEHMKSAHNTNISF